MIDGNISMEEDTELRDLVVQTLENNGVLAKVRAELRASVFLALEEQESVVNPEPLLSKTVKQYLANSEGKLLFSLVREFLEYFGLDYTISVYDPETYSGKDYNYIGRNKLCEKLGINTSEPLLGELLKGTLNGVLNNSDKIDETNDSRLNKTSETSTNFNATFEVSVPKIDHKDTATTTTITNDDSSDKADSISDFSQEIPINVTITDKKNNEIIENTSIKNCFKNDKLRDCTNIKSLVIDNDNNIKSNNNLTEENQNNIIATTCSTNQTTKIDNNTNKLLNKSEHLIKFDESTYFNDDKNNKQVNNVDLQNTNNAQLNNQNDFGKTDGKNLNICTKKNDTLLGDLPPIVTKNNSIFSDLPPLNGKKTNINDLKELMDIGLTGDGVDNYEEDFASSASGSTNEQSPIKDTNKIIDNPEKSKTDEKIINSARSEEISDDIEEVLSENVSSLEGASGAKSLSMGITSDRIEEV